MTLTRSRMIVLVVVIVLAIGAAIGYFTYQRSSADAQASNAPVVEQATDLNSMLATDHVVFRSTALGPT